MRKKLPRITKATALDNMRLDVHFEDGWSSVVDLSEFVAGFKSLKPLRDVDLFPRVAVEEWGSGLTWDDEGPLSIAADCIDLDVELDRGLAPTQRFIQLRRRFKLRAAYLGFCLLR